MNMTFEDIHMQRFQRARRNI